MHEENQNKQKRTLKDVSHVFLSSLEEKKEESVALSSSVTFDSHRFTPALSIVNIFPVAMENFSLLLHVYFAQLLFHSPYKIYILSVNPHNDSWRHLERQFSLPSFIGIDFSKCIRTFKLHQNVELLAISQEMFDEFFSFRQTSAPAPQVFDTKGKPVLFLLDCANVDFYLRERVLPLLDCCLIVTPARIEQLRIAYKALKAFSSVCPQTAFKLVLNNHESKPLESFIQQEINHITARFLNNTVDVIGFCACDAFMHTHNIHWGMNTQEQVLKINIDFLSQLKKDNWSEELLSLYQTVVSNVKL